MIPTAHRWEIEDFDYRTWIAKGRLEIIRPPYDARFEVTPGTTFDKNIWPFPINSLPAGHRSNNEIDFEASRFISDEKKLALSIDKHPTLIQQLKEFTVAIMFLRHHLAGRIEAAKPLTILRDFQRISCLFTNLAAQGVTSLSQVDQQIIDTVFSTIPVSASTHEALIRHFSDLIVLSSKNLISESFKSQNFSIQSRHIACDTNRVRGARTLQEAEVSFIISRSRTYIDSVSAISQKILERRDGSITCANLMEWSYNNLPVKQGLVANLIEYQLTWLVKSSAYNLLIFHLGSRASEGLSLTKNSIFATKDVNGKYSAFVRLTVFKGSKTGVPRTYRVHPYLLRVDAALKEIAAATGRSSDELVFSKQGVDLEVATNSLNHRLRKFVEMHGESIDISSHSGRFTLADIVAASVKDPFPALQFLFGHQNLAEAMAYGMHGPAGLEMRSAGVAAMAEGISSFIDRCQEATEIGGICGTTISDALQAGIGCEELKEQMLSTHAFPLKVGEDRYCVKPHFARGACSAVTGDDMPEIEFCSADCSFQAQFGTQRIHWEQFIENAPQYYSDPLVSTHEKIRKSNELQKQIVAWPKLKNVLSNMIKNNPHVKMWFY